MKLSEPIDRVRDLAGLNDTVQDTVEQILTTVKNVLKLESTGDTRRITYLEAPLFRRTLQEWCERHPEQPARVLTIRPWDNSDREEMDYDYAGATRREIVSVLRRQFDNSFLMTRFEPGTFALLLTGENGAFVENDFDWMSRLEGLRTELQMAIPLSFHLKSAQWPRQASTATSLIDAASPEATRIRAEEPAGEESGTILEDLLDGRLRERVEGHLPDSIRKRLTYIDELTDSSFFRDPVGYLERVN